MVRYFIFPTAIILIFLTLGCGRNIETPYQGDPTSSLLPKTEQKNEGEKKTILDRFCQMDAQKKYTGVEITGLKKGTNTAGHAFAEGGGCILRPIREVLAVTHNREALVWAKSTLVDFQKLTHATIPFFFSTKYEAGPFFFKQDWIMEWYQSIKAGEIKAPEQIVINFKKVSGTSHISHWEGTIELKFIEPMVTSFAMYHEITASQTGPAEAEIGVKEFIERLRNLVPEWRYL